MLAALSALEDLHKSRTDVPGAHAFSMPSALSPLDAQTVQAEGCPRRRCGVCMEAASAGILQLPCRLQLDAFPVRQEAA